MTIHYRQIGEREEDSRDGMAFAVNWEPPMRAQDEVATAYLDEEQRLMVMVKPLSITLLGGHHFRVAIKVGAWDRQETIATILIDSRSHTCQPEGSIAADFDRYRETEDPLQLPPEVQTDWFTCCAIDSWLQRLLESSSLEPTLLWGSP